MKFYKFQNNFILNIFNSFDKERIFNDDQLGTCILSDKDKTIQPDAYRVATDDEEYIENQCVERGSFCFIIFNCLK